MLKSETLGWGLSATLHISVVVVALVGLPSFQKERPAPPPPIAIDFVKIAEKDQVVEPQPEQVAQEPEVRQQPQPNFAREEVAAQAPSEAVPLPDAKPQPVAEKPKPKPKPQASERQRLVARVAPRSKPKAPSRLKSSRIAALIDRSIKEEQENTPKTEEVKEAKAKTPKKEEAKPDPFANMRARIATATFVTALQNKMAGCWNLPTGAKGVQDMRVMMKISIGSEGNLLRPPEPVNAGDLNAPENAFYRVFVESAKRAVIRCAPFPEAVDYLRETRQEYILFNFDPTQFLGG